MKDLGALKYFLGIKVAKNPIDIFPCQCKYALDIIYEVVLLEVKLANIPLKHNHNLTYISRWSFSR
uniref:Reverse transcriptase Ty1/copia-type domain-containing protein n=1 Tax=Cajanus cajan TaxID=3821 RepID=A0A151S0I8_CAJCA|nr:hypothetical protein KK1_030038 [Cajanus cajan]